MKLSSMQENINDYVRQNRPPPYTPQHPGGESIGLTKEDKIKWFKDAFASLHHAHDCLQHIGEPDLAGKVLIILNILGQGKPQAPAPYVDRTPPGKSSKPGAYGRPFGPEYTVNPNEFSDNF